MTKQELEKPFREPTLLEACRDVLARLMNMDDPVTNLDRGRRLSSISILGRAIGRAESQASRGEVSDYQPSCGYTDEG